MSFISAAPNAEYGLRGDWDFTAIEECRSLNSEWPVSVGLDGSGEVLAMAGRPGG
jgi:hypothetical protein